jgi:Arc/MetJ-type ribon-helix-helix transcriptional regulator
MKTYEITLPDEFAAFVDRVLADGQWGTIEDLVTYGLARAQDDIRQDQEMDLVALRKAIQVGIDQADRGEVKELDMAAVWERAVQRVAERREKAHAAGDANGSS